MSRKTYKFAARQLCLGVAILLGASNASAVTLTSTNQTVTSIKLTGYGVSLTIPDIDPGCSATTLTFSLDESSNPGGRAVYSLLLTAKATGRPFDISYEDSPGICNVVNVELY